MHKQKLQVQSTATKPADPEPTTVEALTITAMTHYRDRTDELLPEGESVEEGTTIRTEITFAKPIRTDGLVITYPVTTGKKRLTHSTGVHWRGTYQLSRDGTTVLAKLNASGETFSFTIETASARDGSTLKQPVTTSEIPVVPRTQPTVPAPQEPEVPNTAPQEPGAPTTQKPTVPATPDPTPKKPTGTDYTFTIEDKVYPGYNPSPKLQQILNTHPSAQLPFFEEAVKKTEVISWAYRIAWNVYLNNPSSYEDVAIRDRVLRHFGIMNRSVLTTLSKLYFTLPAHNLGPHSRYWFIVEYLRLAMVYPDADRLELLYELFPRNRENIVGIINPND